MTTYEEILPRVREWEATSGLLQYTVAGWRAWPLVRFLVVEALVQNPMPARAGLARGDLVRLAARDVPGWLRPRRAPFLAMGYASSLAEPVGEQYKDIYLDDLLGELGGGFKVEMVNNPLQLARRQQALRPAGLTTALLELVVRVVRQLERPRSVVWAADGLSVELRRLAGCDPLPPRFVRRHLLSFYWTRLAYRWLLGRVRPRAVFLCDPGEHALVTAAKERGIRTIELQHGYLSGDLHGAYSWPAATRPLKGRMPLPDVLLLYGDAWAEDLRAGGFWDEELVVVGSPRLDAYRRQRPAPRPDTGTVVFTSQGTDVPAVIAYLRQFLAEAEKLAVNVRLLIKLHPIYETDKSPYLAAFGDDPRVEVRLGSEPPSTFEAIAGAHLHASISSTCHYDALGLGVPTAVLPLATHTIVAPLYQSGAASLVRTPAELLAILQRARTEPTPTAGERYFRPNALANMRAYLESQGLLTPRERPAAGPSRARPR